MTRALAGAAAALIGLAGAAAACSLCGDQRDRRTMRQEAAAAKMVLYGELGNARLDPGAGTGRVDLKVEHVVKDHAARGGRKTLTLPRYVPVDPKSPPKALVFCDVDGNRVDAVGGPVKSPAVVAYVRGGLALDARDRAAALLYFFRHLDAADADVAADAFLEFARASDAEVAAIGPKLDPGRLRKLVADPKTPAERVGLFAYLLAACGGDTDAELLLGRLRAVRAEERSSFGGLLAGYVLLRPAEGWAFAAAALADAARPFPERYAVVTAMRFLHAVRPGAWKAEALKAYAAALSQDDTADLAVEDLRRRQWWDLTPAVAALSGREVFKVPIVKRNVVRYALSCPEPAAKKLVAGVAAAEPDLVNDVREGLEFERSAAKP